MITNRSVLLQLVISFVVGLTGCRETAPPPSGTTPPNNGDIYDVDANGIPKFAPADYIELAKIYRISKFRSAEGHDYSDAFESCRSMKHYFNPKGGIDWSSVKIYSPVAGKVSRIFEEWAGTQVQIQSQEYPAFYFIIFHVNLLNPLHVGDTVTAGQQLGTHIGSQTWSDIAIGVNTPGGWKLVSYFNVITDPVVQNYRPRGVASRDALITPKEARDADSLRCNGETFTTTGTIGNWVVLN